MLLGSFFESQSLHEIRHGPNLAIGQFRSNLLHRQVIATRSLTKVLQGRFNVLRVLSSQAWILDRDTEARGVMAAGTRGQRLFRQSGPPDALPQLQRLFMSRCIKLSRRTRNRRRNVAFVVIRQLLRHAIHDRILSRRPLVSPPDGVVE